jgi:hypothetical protein
MKTHDLFALTGLPALAGYCASQGRYGYAIYAALMTVVWIGGLLLEQLRANDTAKNHSPESRP